MGHFSYPSPVGAGRYSPSAMSSSRSSVSSVAQRSSVWQDRLEMQCHRSNLPTPTYSIYSDRRGKRTAWSSTVSIPGGPTASARNWYDGNNVNNAKEDAAEVAFRRLIAEDN